MRTLFAAVVLTLAVTSSQSTWAQQPPAGTEPLEQVAWLVGGTWIAETTTPEGRRGTTELTYTWATHRKAIRYTIVRKIDGNVLPALEGLCAWHPGKKQLVLLELDRQGALTESVMQVQGGTLSFNEIIFDADGSTLPVRAEGIRDGENRFVFKASVLKNGAWTEVFEAEYERDPS